MSTSRQRLGQWGESVAVLHLEEKGFQIVERNWRCAQGEIDIVARDGEEIVFVEVKTRRGRQMGYPEEGLTVKKAQRLIELAQLYLSERDLDPDWRVDLVAVELDNTGKLTRCEHVVNAVLGW
jgi:putative endonuclease